METLKNHHLLFFLFAFFSLSAFAQNGTIKGTVKDKESGETIIGANVTIEGTTIGTTTDLDGNFALKVNAGTHIVSISYVSYLKVRLTDIVVKNGQTVTLNVEMEADVQQMDAVEVQAKRETQSDLSVISEIKLSNQVAVGVSAELIAKSQDRDAGQVVRRMPGISLIDDRLIMVRGLGERYNTVLMNDMMMPSSEANSKAFSFDILPSNVIDRIMVYKSGAADMPAEFAGGVVKIYTKDAPDENFTSINIGTGFRQNTTFQDFYTYKGSSTDWLGYDNGTRTLPGGFPDRLQNLTSEQSAAAANQLSNNWAVERVNALPDLRLSAAIGRRFDAGSVRISNMTAISYSNARQYMNVDQARWNLVDPNRLTYLKADDYRDRESQQNVRMGAIHNWAFQLNSRNRIEFRNMFNQLSSDETTLRHRLALADGQDFNATSLRYESRYVLTNQLAGKHELAGGKGELTWNAGYARFRQQEPDNRRWLYQRPLGSGGEYEFTINASPALDIAARFFGGLTENIGYGSANYEYTFNPDKANSAKIKVGAYYEHKNRDFSARFFSYTGTGSGAVFRQPVEQILAPGNVNGSFIGFQEGTGQADRYNATNTYWATFIQTTLPLSAKINLSAGVRLENNRQVLNTVGGGTDQVQLNMVQPFPSANLSYNFTPKTLARVAYNMSWSRPEFREIARFTYYDFRSDALVQGNSNLNLATIHNVDLRYEWYPTPAETFTFGVFYKYFQNPIEVGTIVTGSRRTFTNINANSAQSYGVEMEFKRSLAAIMPASGFFQKTSLVFNGAYIYNRVRMDGNVLINGNLERLQQIDRPMVNQSPYLVNTGLYYEDDVRKLQVTALYNVFGPRIFMVGDGQWPTIYEMPRHIVDLTVTKQVGRGLEFRVGIQDLLNAPYRFVQDGDLNNRITGNDQEWLSYRRGTYTTLSVGYKF